MASFSVQVEKGPAGYGMEIAQDGLISKLHAGGAAEVRAATGPSPPPLLPQFTHAIPSSPPACLSTRRPLALPDAAPASQTSGARVECKITAVNGTAVADRKGILKALEGAADGTPVEFTLSPTAGAGNATTADEAPSQRPVRPPRPRKAAAPAVPSAAPPPVPATAPPPIPAAAPPPIPAAAPPIAPAPSTAPVTASALPSAAASTATATAGGDKIDTEVQAIHDKFTGLTDGQTLAVPGRKLLRCASALAPSCYWRCEVSYLSGGVPLRTVQAG
jgi:hypothetical protein